MTHSVLNVPASDQKAPPCEPWCTDHDAGGEVCSTDLVQLDFDTAGVRGVVHNTNVCLTSSEDGTSILFGINGVGPYGLTIDSAEQFANELLAKVREARRAGIAVDLAGYASFTTRAAAQVWLAARPGRGLQCASPDCGEVYLDAERAFGCCGQSTALPVVGSDDCLWWVPVPADDLFGGAR